ncbi:ComEC/Rec2 family competence protein [Clostridium sp. MB40-C1]|uniref:ComEC/Rec2 family competence protein n=1 Tax=Clostridium sp. MB40-C1 TaxID=3070996 RepID=UPI0027DFE9F3|nr:ComEC/Rec2 family competence protein [Clostridium sp. MB40-C1]WMJ79077.1 ComEC/Rec2 family competence protein [Clostridium sp. MB40-C1]
MKYKKKFYKILIICASLIFILTSCVASTNSLIDPKYKLTIHYIDVGQGDSILIQINDKNMLIDAGTKSASVSSYLKKNKITKLDYIVATHPHEDHIGGMASIINNFDINNFYAPKITSNSSSFRNMLSSLNKRNIKITSAKARQSIDLDKDVKCFIVAPNSTYYDKINNHSIVIKLIYKNISFLFTGDAESFSEDEILKNGFNIKSDVLKLGHHGSNSSTSDKFLNEVDPKVAIISCGKGNDYGHPHKEILNKLKNKKILLYRTDLDGTIILQSDGTKIIRR